MTRSGPTIQKGAIVAGFDGSEGARRAVEWAVAEALTRDRALLIVLALEPIMATTAYGWYPAADFGDEQRIRASEELLARITQQCRRAAPTLTVAGLLKHEGPAQALATIVDEIDAGMLVIGSSGHSAIPRMLLGSTAAQLVGTLQQPIVVVRGDNDAEPTSDLPVVAGADDSTASEHAVAFAFEFAERHRAPLRVVHAWSNQPLDIFDAVDQWDEDSDRMRAAANEITEKYLGALRERHPRVDAHMEFVRHRAAQALLEWSEYARLLVVGTRGHGAVKRALLGSVSHAALYHARCPVAVLHGAGQDEEPASR